jgi:hypothetical protein
MVQKWTLHVHLYNSAEHLNAAVQSGYISNWSDKLLKKKKNPI